MTLDKDKYPNIHRHSEVSDEMDTLNEFLDHLGSKKISLASTQIFVETVDVSGIFELVDRWADRSVERYGPIPQSREQLLFEYFGIDAAALDKERRDLLTEQTKAYNDNQRRDK